MSEGPMTDRDAVECPACELVTAIRYRCQHCGHDLAGDKATEGRR